jgi:hypothetical protein
VPFVVERRNQGETVMNTLDQSIVEVLPARLEMTSWKRPPVSGIFIGSVKQFGANVVVHGYGNTQINQNNISLGGYNNSVG